MKKILSNFRCSFKKILVKKLQVIWKKYWKNLKKLWNNYYFLSDISHIIYLQYLSSICLERSICFKYSSYMSQIFASLSLTSLNSSEMSVLHIYSKIFHINGDRHKPFKWQNVNFSLERFENFLKHYDLWTGW